MATNNKICSLCSNLTDEGSAILVMGGYGHPRLICEECEKEIDQLSLGRDYEKIREAMNTIGKKLTVKEPEDLVLETVNGILKDAADRAEKINKGEYDFSLDENVEETGEDDIPEELLETEEDKALDERDEKRQKKFDKIFNIVALAVFAGVIGYLAYKFISGLM